jgi:hypothetical protein
MRKAPAALREVNDFMIIVGLNAIILESIIRF